MISRERSLLASRGYQAGPMMMVLRCIVIGRYTRVGFAVVIFMSMPVEKKQFILAA